MFSDFNVIISIYHLNALRIQMILVVISELLLSVILFQANVLFGYPLKLLKFRGFFMFSGGI